MLPSQTNILLLKNNICVGWKDIALHFIFAINSIKSDKSLSIGCENVYLFNAGDLADLFRVVLFQCQLVVIRFLYASTKQKFTYSSYTCYMRLLKHVIYFCCYKDTKAFI